MPDYTVSADVDSMLRSANDAAIRSAIGVGTTDAPTFLKATAYDATSSNSNLNGFQLSSASFTGKHGLFSRYNSSSEGWVLMTNGIGNIAGWVNTPGPWVSQSIGFSLGSTVTSNPDTFLHRDGAEGILAQRNGVNAQAFRVANSVGASPLVDYDRGVFDFKTTTNTLRIGTENGGTYTLARPIDFVTGGAVRMSIAAGGGVNIPAGGLTIVSGGANITGILEVTGIRSGFYVQTTQFMFGGGGVGDVALQRNANGVVEINSTTAGTYRDLRLRNVIQSPGVGTTVTPANNSELVFETTSNTSVTLKLKGTDGTVRSVALTLA